MIFCELHKIAWQVEIQVVILISTQLKFHPSHPSRPRYLIIVASGDSEPHAQAESRRPACLCQQLYRQVCSSHSLRMALRNVYATAYLPVQLLTQVCTKLSYRNQAWLCTNFKLNRDIPHIYPLSMAVETIGENMYVYCICMYIQCIYMYIHCTWCYILYAYTVTVPVTTAVYATAYIWNLGSCDITCDIT